GVTVGCSSGRVTSADLGTPSTTQTLEALATFGAGLQTDSPARVATRDRQLATAAAIDARYPTVDFTTYPDAEATLGWPVLRPVLKTSFSLGLFPNKIELTPGRISITLEFTDGTLQSGRTIALRQALEPIPWCAPWA